MNDNSEPRELHERRPEIPEVKDIGVATELTHGSPLITPWYESGIPPYNHWLPL